MKVLVTGSRKWPDDPEGRGIIRAKLQELPPNSTVVHGDCHLGGADKIADEEARLLGHKVVAIPVNIEKDGVWPVAGNRRNSRMLNEQHTRQEPIDYVLAFPLPGSRGTWDMVGKAKSQGIRVWIYPTGWEEEN